jgi:transcriptional regulator with XRE-family HTH domain
MSTVRTLNPGRIYTARLRVGLVQEDVAHELRRRGFRTTAKSVSQWERGLNAPRAEVIPALADILGVSLDELYSGDADEEDASVMAAELLTVLRRLVRKAVASEAVA